MKKFIILISVLLSITSVIAQTPQAFKYQAVARDINGDVLVNKSIALKVSILKDGTSGMAVYTETHNPSTNDFGLINLEIGNGALVTGNFMNIEWGNDTYFIKIEMDATGGTNYQLMGTSQLLSVPYALYAKKNRKCKRCRCRLN